jgi:hypothetical protein
VGNLGHLDDGKSIRDIFEKREEEFSSSFIKVG